MMPHTCRWSAYSLTELLVGIAILAILASLILAGVQKVRVTAAKASCGNNLRQVSIGLQNYCSSHGNYPCGSSLKYGEGRQPYLSWMARILPYCGNDPLWHKAEEAFGISRFFQDPPHPVGFVVPLYSCPSDARARTTHRWGKVDIAFSSYLGNQGTDPIHSDGALFLDSQVKIQEIRDGSSQTLVVGERPPSADLRLGWWYGGLGVDGEGTLDSVMGVRLRNTTTRYADCGTGPFLYATGRFEDNCSTFHFWSPHPGGAHFAFADGSVSFLRYSANDILPALATRAGGEAVTVPD